MKLTTGNPFGEQDFPGILPEEGINEYIQEVRAKIRAELDLCAAFLCYRVQQDLYEVLTEEGLLEDLSWEAFLLHLEWNKELRTVSTVVLLSGIFELSEQDYFDCPPIPSEDDFLDKEPDILHCIRLFPDKTGRGLLQILMLRAKSFQHIRQAKSGKEQSWEEYLEELSTNETVWAEFLQGFRNALRRLDFKALWRQRDLNSLLTGE